MNEYVIVFAYGMAAGVAVTWWLMYEHNKTKQ